MKRENFPYDPEIIKSSSPEETAAIGEKIGGLLEKGSVLGLRGMLGAGKTCLIKGIAKNLEIDDEITSPTYTIVSEYECKKNNEKIPFYHIDAYRLKGDDDFAALGGEEYIYGNGITVIEWSEKISASLPPYTIFIEIEITGANSRNIRIINQNEHSGN